jgi:cytochrome oxidase assembly protein ShyY1
MYRFARQPRWIAGHLLVALAGVVMVNLGFWQLRRLDERRAANALVAARERMAPVAFGDSDPVTGDAEFRRATATGTFDAAREVLVGYRSRKGLPGFHVITPLVLTDGKVLLVNRGFVPLALADRWPAPDAAPPPGEVTVVGTVRRSEAGNPLEPPVGKPTATPRTNRVDVARIAETLDVPGGDVLDLHLELREPVPPGFPEPLPPLDLGEGPHLSYAVQWFAFSAVAAGGWAALLWRRATRTGHAHDGPAGSLAAAEPAPRSSSP